jgi:hypothetical protein
MGAGAWLAREIEAAAQLPAGRSVLFSDVCLAGAWGGNNKAPLVDDDEEAPKATHTVPSAPIAPAPNPAAAAFTSSSAMGGAYPGSFGVGMPASSSAPAGSGSMVRSGSVVLFDNERALEPTLLGS